MARSGECLRGLWWKVDQDILFSGLSMRDNSSDIGFEELSSYVSSSTGIENEASSVEH